jgi:hypothetical protein
VTPHTPPEKVRLSSGAVLGPRSDVLGFVGREVYLLLALPPLPGLSLQSALSVALCTVWSRLCGSWVHALSRPGWNQAHPSTCWRACALSGVYAV